MPCRSACYWSLQPSKMGEKRSRLLADGINDQALAGESSNLKRVVAAYGLASRSKPTQRQHQEVGPDINDNIVHIAGSVVDHGSNGGEGRERGKFPTNERRAWTYSPHLPWRFVAEPPLTSQGSELLC